MRKIESEMNRAVRSRTKWSSGNTEVFINDNNCANVYLHGNLIAWVSEHGVRLFDGGWRTTTTKSRLNALLDEFAYGTHVYQRDFTWYIEDRNFKREFEGGELISLG